MIRYFHSVGVKVSTNLGCKVSGDEERHDTALLLCRCNSTKLTSLLIYKRKPLLKGKILRWIFIHFHLKRCMNEEGVKVLPEKVWLMRFRGLIKKTRLLVWDEFQNNSSGEIENKNGSDSCWFNKKMTSAGFINRQVY